LLPWCACMGATFPFAMLAVRDRFPAQARHSFSYLYLANVIGAVAGAILPLFLIELFGFQRTLWIAAGLNALLASTAFALTIGKSKLREDDAGDGPFTGERSAPNSAALWLLFATGLTSLGVEVIWTRLYTPSLGTFVYAFATILAIYLAATYAGSWFYRIHEKSEGPASGTFWAGLGSCALLALVAADPRLRVSGGIRVLLGVGPFSALAGFATPMLVDLYSEGDPNLAGRAYAVNISGCVVGPLLAGFMLLPRLGERGGLCALAIPWLLFGFLAGRSGRRRSLHYVSVTALAAGTVAVFGFTNTFESRFNPRIVRRDNTATVIATGEGRDKRLLINGIGITGLTPITKIMAHLPLAMLSYRPQSALVICFGMGTSHLSALSWGIHSTAVELVPSVPALLSFFHPRSAVRSDSQLSRIVIDDGRAYLERTEKTFDVVVVDPPPPPEAAASSLLYSKEFYAAVKRRLAPRGILQQWLPGGDPATCASVARALQESFPFVRVFRPFGLSGYHFLASMSSMDQVSAGELAKRLPASASQDLLEWGPAPTAEQQFEIMLRQEILLQQLIAPAPGVPALTDDRPINEYYFLRRR
ncbi:MAG TPA: hypothetical protein VGF08_10600, partial [Terriglobales bacterium]